MKKFKLAVIQNKPIKNKEESINYVIKKIEEASNNNSDLVVLPEIFYYPYELRSLPKIEEANKETLNKLALTAKKLGIYICTGSTVEKVGSKRFNKSYLINRSGDVILEYCKSHLFDVNFNNLRTRESLVFDRGDTFPIVETELGKIGILICYDIRFPEAARKLALQGAEIILVPAAFNTVTGPLHWHIIFRARAIENQVFLAAASPALDMEAKYHAYGHSMIIDPWGTILSEAGVNEDMIYSEIDPAVLMEVRGKLPLLKHRRPDIY